MRNVNADVEAGNVLGGMASTLQDTLQAKTLNSHQWTELTEQKVGHARCVVRAWALVVQLLGQAFVTKSKAGQALLNVRMGIVWFKCYLSSWGRTSIAMPNC
eukprot:363637-Chlamydomonas_euryale.AAC.18